VARCRELAEAEAGRGWLAWAARTSQLAWDASKPARAAVVATDQEAARALLRQIAEHASREPDARLASPGGAFYARGSELGKIAFLFPGQGSQYLEMGADLAMAHDAARAVWDREADAPVAEEALHQVVYPVPAFGEEAQAAQATRLTATEWAQPAIGATSAAMLALLRDLGLEPDCVGGHSFGEITALHAAGVLDERDFLRVARRRGELMRDAAAIPGAMTAVSVDISKLRPLLDEWSLDVVIANHNGPRQVVLSGSIEAMVQAEAKLSAARITFKRLPVATAFHSKLVSPSSEPFLTFLRDVELRPASVDVFSNAAAAVYPEAADDKRARLAEQIASPVRFVEQIEAMYERGAAWPSRSPRPCASSSRSRRCTSGASVASSRWGRARCSRTSWVASSREGPTWRSPSTARAGTA